MYIHVQISHRRPVTLTMTEARASFTKVLTRAEHGEAVQITRGGRPVAVVVSFEQYREAEAGTAAEAFRAFMTTLDRKVLRGPDPWKGARHRSTGRDFRW